MKQLLLLVIISVVAMVANCQRSKELLFAGTYTDGQPGKGIYVYAADTATGELTALSTGEDITNPSFITISPNGRYLYACTDTKTLVPGSISAFAIDSTAGTIRFINKQSSAGANPVYLSVYKNNGFVVTGNYTGGSVAVLPLNSNGGVGAAIQFIQFTDSSIPIIIPS